MVPDSGACRVRADLDDALGRGALVHKIQNAVTGRFKTEEQKTAIRFLYAGQGIGRPFVAPPNLPADKLKILRDAFDKTMKDPDFIADAKAQKFEVDPRDGAYLEALIRSIYATPKPIIDKISKLIQ